MHAYMIALYLSGFSEPTLMGEINYNKHIFSFLNDVIMIYIILLYLALDGCLHFNAKRCSFLSKNAYILLYPAL